MWLCFSYNKCVYNREKTMKKAILGILFAIALAGCGQIYDTEPVGVGYSTEELKLSPCACMLVYQA